MTGGYIVGFLVSALLMWAMEALFGSKKWVLPVSMVVGLIACYAFGTAWFMVVYTSSKGAITLGAVLGMCVIPYIIPDAVKIAVALLLTKALKRVGKEAVSQIFRKVSLFLRLDIPVENRIIILYHTLVLFTRRMSCYAAKGEIYKTDD